MSASNGDESVTDFEAYLDAFGDQIRNVVAPHAVEQPQRTRPRRVLKMAGATAGLALLVVVTIALSGTGRDGRHFDAVAVARAALEPRREIIYMAVTTSFGDGSRPMSTHTEQWSAADPPRWRVVQVLPSKGSADGTGAYGDAHGPIRGRQEFSYANGQQRLYLAQRNTLRVVLGHETPAPDSFRFPGGGPATDLRRALDSGAVVDNGNHYVGGRAVRQLVSETDIGGVRRRLTYDVDANTFAPVDVQLRTSLPHGDPRVMRIHVDAYRRLPLTAATAKLLTIKTNSATKVSVRTSKELRAQGSRAPRPRPAITPPAK